MGTTRRNEIRGTFLGLTAMALIAAFMAISAATMIGGDLRSILPSSSQQQSPGTHVGVLERR